DLAQAAFGRNERVLRELPARPSEHVRGRLFFTPFPGEPVGWMTEQCGDRLFCFSSDYPHPEGTKDTIGRFEATMGDLTDPELDRICFRSRTRTESVSIGSTASRYTATRRRSTTRTRSLVAI